MQVTETSKEQVLVKLKAKRDELHSSCPHSFDDKYNIDGKYDNTQYLLDKDQYHAQIDCLYTAINRYEADIQITRALRLIK